MALEFGQYLGIFLAFVTVFVVVTLVIFWQRLSPENRQSCLALILMLAPGSVVEIWGENMPKWVRGLCLLTAIAGLLIVVKAMRASRNVKSNSNH